jgi:hypothetical protein
MRRLQTQESVRDNRRRFRAALMPVGVWFVVLSIAGSGLCEDNVSASRAPVEQVKSLQILPAAIQIGGANRQQQIVVTAETAAGKLIDVTRLSEFAIEDSDAARWMAPS